MARVMQRENPGFMATSAWTGVAAAPFQAPTLCTLFRLERTKLDSEKQMSEQQIGLMLADFRNYYGDPEILTVFAVGEASFLGSPVLHHLDVQLRRLLGRPDDPFGGVLLLLLGDFWQKAPPAGISLAETLAATDAPLEPEKYIKVASPDSLAARGLH